MSELTSTQFSARLSVAELSPWRRALYLLVAWVVVSFGQPAWIAPLGILAAAGGFGLAWRAIIGLLPFQRFWLATGWFTAVQLVQLSWLASDKYQGSYIYGVYAVVVIGIGLQFGILALLLDVRRSFSPWRLLAIASCWTLFEWTRLHILSGFPFNPVGMSLVNSDYSAQLASVGGVYLLSFLVMGTNLLLLRAWLYVEKVSLWSLWAAVALLPYLFGWIQVSYHSQQMESENSGSLSVLLVQTAISPSQKIGFGGDQDAFIQPLQQWQRILSLIECEKHNPVDLIVLPEAAVPLGTYTLLYRLNEVKAIFKKALGDSQSSLLSKPAPPFAHPGIEGERLQWFVSNAYIGQGVADCFDTTVIIGLEDTVGPDGQGKEPYSGAFFFQGKKQIPERYAKRILVPMGEYIPFDWCKSFAAEYGIFDSFVPGKEPKVFQGKVPMGISICYEEVYGDLVRQNRQQGAELLVNITNNAWFANSKLPQQHFHHARLRTIENGVPLVRAANTGITGAIDSLGREIALFGQNEADPEWTAGCLRVDVPLYHYRTPYSTIGDSLIVGLSFIFLFGYMRFTWNR